MKISESRISTLFLIFATCHVLLATVVPIHSVGLVILGGILMDTLVDLAIQVVQVPIILAKHAAGGIPIVVSLAIQIIISMEDNVSVLVPLGIGQTQQIGNVSLAIQVHPVPILAIHVMEGLLLVAQLVMGITSTGDNASVIVLL